MNLFSTRLIVNDIKKMIGFYEFITEVDADWLAPVFAELKTEKSHLAFGSLETVALFKEGCAEPSSNHTAILEFLVDDVDKEFERLESKVDLVQPPKDMPWGNRTFQFRDPEGNLVSFFTPKTLAAKERFNLSHKQA